MEALLTIRSKSDGSLREINREIGNGLVIGRGAERGILLDGPDLSREHVVVTTDDNEAYVTDLSSNGTWLNGTRLQRSVRSRIQSGDLLDVPGYSLSLRLLEPERTAVVESSIGHSVNLVSEPDHGAAETTVTSSGALAFLNPARKFIGSFTFGEKFFACVALTGLFLLYSYFGS